MSRPNTSLAAATLALGLAFTGGAAHAALIAYDGFDTYATGANIHGASGGTGWTNNWSSAGGAFSPSTIVTTPLSYTGGSVSVSGGTKAVQYTSPATATGLDAVAARNFTSQAPSASSPTYVSFLFQTSNMASGANDLFQVSPMNATERKTEYGVLLRDTTSSSGLTRWGVRSNNFSSQTFTPPDVTNGTTYFVVMKLDRTATEDRVTLFVNPTSDVEASNAGVAATGGTQFAAAFAGISFRTALLEAGNGESYILDEVRVGSTFADVVPVPEPTALAVLGFAASGLIVRRRR